MPSSGCAELFSTRRFHLSSCTTEPSSTWHRTLETGSSVYPWAIKRIVPWNNQKFWQVTVDLWMLHKIGKSNYTVFPFKKKIYVYLIFCSFHLLSAIVFLVVSSSLHFNLSPSSDFFLFCAFPPTAQVQEINAPKPALCDDNLMIVALISRASSETHRYIHTHSSQHGRLGRANQRQRQKR